ncbi:MAG: YciI family protein [Pseudomonadota bacterium]
MLYAIFGIDKPNSLALRLETRAAHLARINELVQSGRLVLAGPHPAIDSSDPGEAGFSGSLIIAEFPSLDDAKSWAEADPYATQGVFEKVTVKPFKQVLP